MSKSERSRTAASVPGTPTRSVKLARLTDAEREVYVSCEEEGLRPAELAQYTEWSESTVRTLLARGRRKVGESDT
ncbi:sigma factor-like helix-turn-helix DNA-binding protein [Halobacterium litoreum]|uniref:Sigma factor-like helix-turn-helix DNA-binding protein n=1 Tax=Halobacterium litoreum TaxID=2039234 RepID=A0ABD5NAN4_9EURY|nr:sigma-70 region 4 domain-containing protein [Halobacterium litoreum]UHH14881.1 sigma-70 region 4 domain-containing protein [Halobacterium litoreum]